MTHWALIWYVSFAGWLGGEVDFGPMKGECHDQVRVLFILEPWVKSLCVPQFRADNWESE